MLVCFGGASLSLSTQLSHEGGRKKALHQTSMPYPKTLADLMVAERMWSEQLALKAAEEAEVSELESSIISALPHLAKPCNAMSCDAMSCDASPCLNLLCFALLYPALSCLRTGRAGQVNSVFMMYFHEMQLSESSQQHSLPFNAIAFLFFCRRVHLQL